MTKPRSLVVMTFRKGVRADQLVGKASEFRILNHFQSQRQAD